MAFATLIAAANGCQATMFTRYTAATLNANVLAFNNAVSPLFADDDPNQRTCGDWLVLLQSYQALFAAANPFSNNSEAIFVLIANAMYRFFYQVSIQTTSGFISGATAVAVLAAANANLS